MLVPYTAAQMFDLVDRVEHYPEFLPWCGGAEVLESTRRRQDGAHRHRLSPACAPISRPTTSIEPGESIVITLRDGPFRHLHGEWRFSALAPDGVQGRARARIRVHDTAARARRRTGVRSHREHVHRRVRPPRRSDVSESLVIVTVVLATAGRAGHRPGGAWRRVRRSPTRSVLGAHRALWARPGAAGVRGLRRHARTARASRTAIASRSSATLVADPKDARRGAPRAAAGRESRFADRRRRER